MVIVHKYVGHFEQFLLLCNLAVGKVKHNQGIVKNNLRTTRNTLTFAYDNTSVLSNRIFNLIDPGETFGIADLFDHFLYFGGIIYFSTLDKTK